MRTKWSDYKQLIAGHDQQDIFLSLIVEGHNAGILFQDKCGEIISVNKKAADILGTTPERIYGLKDISNLWKTWDIRSEACNPVPFEKTPFIRAVQTGEPQTEVLVIRLPNGENRWLHFSSQPVFEDSRTVPYAVVSSITDVTEERNLSYRLKEREAYLVQLLTKAHNRLLLLTRAASNAIWEWDMQTGDIFRNDALMDMIGYNFEKPRGLSWWLRRIHPEDRNRLSDKVKETTDKNLQSWEEEYRFKCADGTYKHMHDKGFVVYENGLPVKMIGSLQDITGLKDLENQLVQEKLRRQQEISETVIRVQEKERTRIGHELHDNVNQILSTVKLFVDMLTPSRPEEKEIKQKSVDYIMLAIDEIRKLSRELTVPQLHQGGLVPSIRNLADDIHLSTDIRIKFTHDHENDLLSPGIKVTLYRIVQEQLKNILKHSRASQVDILLQCREGEALLIVKDNGVGFESTGTHRGIGLSNMYERTRFYNGTVEIVTAPGEGCMLTVKIPVS